MINVKLSHLSFKLPLDCSELLRVARESTSLAPVLGSSGFSVLSPSIGLALVSTASKISSKRLTLFQALIYQVLLARFLYFSIFLLLEAIISDDTRFKAWSPSSGLGLVSSRLAVWLFWSGDCSSKLPRVALKRVANQSALWRKKLVYLVRRV